GGTFAWFRRGAARRLGEAAAFGGTVAGLFAWLLWRSRPDFLPIGGGVDLTHHLLLIGFIEKHWTLPHDPSVESFLGEMMHYTPGSQVLAGLAGAWLRTDGLHAMHPVAAGTVALKAGLVVLVALRALPTAAPRIPFALAAALMLLAPSGYF